MSVTYLYCLVCSAPGTKIKRLKKNLFKITTFFPNGKKRIERWIFEGELCKKQEWYKNGNRCCIEIYSTPDMQFIDYRNNKKWLEMVYKNGKKMVLKYRNGKKIKVR